MDMGEVVRAWGEPYRVDFAGEPDKLNQKWVYPEGPRGTISGGMSRILYFEQGRLAGWDRSSLSPPFNQ